EYSDGTDYTYYKLTISEATYLWAADAVRLLVKDEDSEYVITSGYQFKEAREYGLPIVVDPSEMLIYYLKQLSLLIEDKETIDKLIQIAKTDWELALTLYKSQQII
ncbi:hypothetical protein EB077_14150, partial [bacterium]|nr:hypothetical protein [bacterium]